VRVLTVNAGSSSLKLSLVDSGGSGDATEFGGTATEFDDLGDALRSEPDAVAHRVVHGGPTLGAATVIDDEVEAELDRLTELAPLHQPPALDGIRRARAALPDVPHVACPDTVFHRTLPAEAATYPVPREWREDFGIHRYGFHGLAHGYTARRMRELLPDARRVVIAHLGAGASLCAVLDGRSVDTTMGFTPEDGLVMATRCGAIDPGIVTWLSTARKLAPAEVAETMATRSGLLGLAGTGNMKEILEAGGGLAIDVYLHRLCGLIGSMVAALDGLDALVFTGGSGEKSAELRRLATERLGWLGVAVDAERNAEVPDSGPDDTADIGTAGAAVRTVVVHVREDLEAARMTRELLGG
jgi:acetate kinase